MRTRYTLLLAGLLFVAPSADSAILYGNVGCDGGELMIIDTTAETATEAPGTDYCGQDVELASDPAVIDQVNNALLVSYDIATGDQLTLQSLTNLPGDTGGVTALERIDDVLYGAFAVIGDKTATPEFGTINVETGVVTSIGTMTGMSGPAGGLHYLNGTMYTVTAANAVDSSLFSVDLQTGAATLIAPITLDGAPIRAISALTYADGKMFVSRPEATNDTSLYSIDLASGVLTVEFDMGVPINGLTTVRTPSVPGSIVIDGGYLKLDTTGGIAPLDLECSLPEHLGRLVLDETGDGTLYLCAEDGWTAL